MKEICTPCKGTGFTDGVNRGFFAMEPRDKICAPCRGSGWVEPYVRAVILVEDPKPHGEWVDFPPDPCRYPNCSCHFGYQQEGADNCPERRK